MKFKYDEDRRANVPEYCEWCLSLELRTCIEEPGEIVLIASCSHSYREKTDNWDLYSPVILTEYTVDITDMHIAKCKLMGNFTSFRPSKDLK